MLQLFLETGSGSARQVLVFPVDTLLSLPSKKEMKHDKPLLRNTTTATHTIETKQQHKGPGTNDDECQDIAMSYVTFHRT